jgi:hypothetical protein
LVREDPTRFSDFADFLTDPAIRLVYVHHYLSGIHDGIKNKTGRLEDAVISLCEYVVSLKEDTFEGSPGRNEPGLFAAQMEVARLLEEALHSDDPYLTKKQLDRIRALLISLVHHANPEPGDDAKNSFDPFTQSLNCVRGQAMHGIIHYSLYLILNFTPFIRHRVKGNFDIWSRIQPVINTLRLNAA